MVKYLAMVERVLGMEYPPKEAASAVLQECEMRAFTVPQVREGWRRETSHSVEISSQQFPGAKPIWIWEVK